MNRPKIKNYHKGRASNEGNGMVGGRWWGCKRLGYVDVDYMPALDGINDDSHFSDVYDYLVERIGEKVRVEAYFNCGKDESVGLPEYCDLDEWFEPEDFINAVNECPFLSKSERMRILADMGDLIEGLDDDAYELYEIDYPEE
jgi:hypothetical protein